MTGDFLETMNERVWEREQLQIDATKATVQSTSKLRHNDMMM